MTTVAGKVDAARYRDLQAEHDAIVVDFWASWCGPCKQYSPIFERVAREFRRDHPDLSVALCAVDIDAAQDIAREAKVKGVPTTVVYVRGKGLFGKEKWKEAYRNSGVVRATDLRRALEAALVA